MRCSDCLLYKTKDCHNNPLGTDFEPSQPFVCYVPKWQQSSTQLPVTSPPKSKMKQQKNVGVKILLVIAAIACGLAVQVLGTIISGITGLGILGTTLFTLLGFAVMGYLIYRWVIKRE